MASKFTGFKHILTSAAVAAAFLWSSAPARAETLDEMYAALAEAESPAEGQRIEARIAAEWAKSGSAAIDLLWTRGQTALEEGDALAAVEHFTAVIDHAPDFAEAYHGRATAFFVLDDYGPALDDLRQTLVMNPRHFGAMRGLAIILEAIGKEEEAFEVTERILAIHPQMQDVAETRQRLQHRLEGIPI